MPASGPGPGGGAEGEPRRAPRVTVSIVNWRTAELTIDCVRSIFSDPERVPGLRVIVVDNGSGDGSAELIAEAIDREGLEGFVTLLRSSENLGFAAGNNLAIRRAMNGAEPPDYVWLLNPDTIVRPGALKILLEFMEADRRVGICGGRSEDPDGTPQVCCFRFPNIIGEFALHLRLRAFSKLFERRISGVPIPEEPRQIDWVSGAHMLVRKEVFDQVGSFDESYFLYYEETDFTLRARRAGWLCWHVPESRVIHLVGQSSGVTNRDIGPRRLPKYWFRSRNRFFALNHGRLYAAGTDLLVILACLLWKVRRVVQRKGEPDPPHYVRDILLSSLVGGIARKHDVRQVGFRPLTRY